MREEQDDRYTPANGGKAQASGGGEVEVLQLSNHSRGSIGRDHLLCRPQRIAGAGDIDVQQRRVVRTDLFKAKFEQPPVFLPGEPVGDPDQRAGAGDHGSEGKAGGRGLVAIGGLTHLVQPLCAEAKGEGPRLLRRRVGEAEDRLGKNETGHMFMFRSFEQESTGMFSTGAADGNFLFYLMPLNEGVEAGNDLKSVGRCRRRR